MVLNTIEMPLRLLIVNKAHKKNMTKGEEKKSSFRMKFNLFLVFSCSNMGSQANAQQQTDYFFEADKMRGKNTAQNHTHIQNV